MQRVRQNWAQRLNLQGGQVQPKKARAGILQEVTAVQERSTKYVKADAKRKPSKLSPMSWLFG